MQIRPQLMGRLISNMMVGRTSCPGQNLLKLPGEIPTGALLGIKAIGSINKAIKPVCRFRLKAPKDIMLGMV